MTTLIIPKTLLLILNFTRDIYPAKRLTVYLHIDEKMTYFKIFKLKNNIAYYFINNVSNRILYSNLKKRT